MKKPHLIALIIFSLIIIWLFIGTLFNKKNLEKERVAEIESNIKDNQFVVEVIEQVANPVTSYIFANASIMPNRMITIRSEITSKVEKILHEEGEVVKKGDVLAILAMDDREFRLAKAKAKTIAAKRNYDSLIELRKKDYTSETMLNNALITLKESEAEEKQILLEIENTNIKVPFAGIISNQIVELGDYVNIGSELFTVVDNDPLIVEAYIPQQEISKIKLKTKINVELATGQKGEGEINFISPKASDATRTFKVQAKMANLNKIPSGLSANIQIPTGVVLANFITPAILNLDKDSNIGVKVVNQESVVEFHIVNIISSNAEGIYVTGLPEKAKIIINGQGFVEPGEKVSFVLSS